MIDNLYLAKYETIMELTKKVKRIDRQIAKTKRSFYKTEVEREYILVNLGKQLDEIDEKLQSLDPDCKIIKTSKGHYVISEPKNIMKAFDDGLVRKF